MLYRNALKSRNILKYNHEEKSIKISFICDVTDSLLKKIDTCHNNPKKPSTTKANKHTSWGYSLFMDCSFDSNKSNHIYNWCKYYMKNFCKDLREHVIKTTNFQRLKIWSLAEKENKSYYKRKLCCIWRNKFKSGIKLYWKVQNHDHYTGKYLGAEDLKNNLRQKNMNEIPEVLHDGWLEFNYKKVGWTIWRTLWKHRKVYKLFSAITEITWKL